MLVITGALGAARVTPGTKAEAELYPAVFFARNRTVYVAPLVNPEIVKGEVVPLMLT